MTAVDQLGSKQVLASEESGTGNEKLIQLNQFLSLALVYWIWKRSSYIHPPWPSK